MAVSTMELSSALSLKMVVGVNENQEDVFKTITFKKVKAAASDQDVYDVAQAISAILKHPVQDILRQQTDQLVGE